MPNHAHATIVGHLGRDAEIKFLANDRRIVNFSVATTRRRKGKDGQPTEDTTWWKCAWWGDRAQKAAQYLTKGKPVLVEGEPHLRAYTTKEGNQDHSLEMEVSNVVLLGSRENAQDQPAPPAPRESNPIRPEPAAGGGDDEPPFHRSELEVVC